MARIVVALAIVAALAATPAAAPAAPAPAQYLAASEQPAPAPAPAPTPVQPVDDGTIGFGELLLIGAAIVGLIGLIWLVISRDARRATGGRRRLKEPEPGSARGSGATRAARRPRRPSAAERQRRKRGRAR
jgi:hypothetical protein